MSHRSTPVSLATLKDLLSAYAHECTGVPRERVEREFGELLLTLVRLAGQRQVARSAHAPPRLVPPRPPAAEDTEH